MNSEIEVYSTQLKLILHRLRALVDGLDDESLNWRPPAPHTNSVYVLAAHTLGNAEAWVLGIACGQPIDRDRPAEFGASGPDPARLIDKAQELTERFEEALAELTAADLDQMREPSQSHYGEGTPRAVSVREALMVTVDHAAGHLGQIEITRDLALAGKESAATR